MLAQLMAANWNISYCGSKTLGGCVMDVFSIKYNQMWIGFSTFEYIFYSYFVIKRNCLSNSSNEISFFKFSHDCIGSELFNYLNLDSWTNSLDSSFRMWSLQQLFGKKKSLLNFPLT